MTKVLLQLLVGIAIAGASSWITVQLSRLQFRSERWWEKKAQAYERVIEAFHNSKKFASEHLDAAHKGRDVDGMRDAELRKLAKEARDEIIRASDIGSFILSSNASIILAKYKAESEAAEKHDTWWEYLDADLSLTDRYMKEFIVEAHRDLKK